ncbi:JAB1/Mov34/MPN/PAD-1 ubiquitin protease-domain-containing protein [Limtongia smithiae]|uniref:JAB1/Mov34/MPN/PAD-1 ubiquitin protease-domain-containing protein n=1 Tax=Limtongia smithiae TaxID=1125753 RepID=UPI0034CE11C1
MDVQMQDAAQRGFEIENNVATIDARDAIYQFDEEEKRRVLTEKPWTKDPNYFKNARISAIALLKMTIHARSGGSIEVMGIMTGKVVGDSIVVMDAFPLAVEGTETRVNPQTESYEYMVSYLTTLKSVGRKEDMVGWYHSHPGYGCWLSGIDVGTQSQNQKYQDPFLAVVIDPNRTISTGKVDIGAFRTYPENYTPPGAQESEYQAVPMEKMEDFGVHASQYYALTVSHFKTSLDTRLLELLWNKYWVSTLSKSSVLTDREFASLKMLHLSKRIPKAETALSSSSAGSPSSGQGAALVPPGGPSGGSGSSRRDRESESELDKVVLDTTKFASEGIHGLIAHAVKERVFGNLKPISS